MAARRRRTSRCGSSPAASISGQYLPFWQEACESGNERACRYEAFLTLTYCNNGSGWACNEAGIQLAEARDKGYPLD